MEKQKKVRRIYSGFDFIFDELDKNPNAEITYYETIEDYLADVLAEDYQEILADAELYFNALNKKTDTAH